MAPVRNSFGFCCIAAFLVVMALASSVARAQEGAEVPAAPAEPLMHIPLNVMVTAVAGWVAADLGEAMPPELPEIVFVDRATMHAIWRSSQGRAARGRESGSNVQALYQSSNRTIFLPEGWTGATPAQVSILVHELVHFFQELRGDTFHCSAAREKLAYEVQEHWLEAHGESLETLGVDRFFLLVATNCMF